VTTRSRTLSDGDIELPKNSNGEEVSFDRLYGGETDCSVDIHYDCYYAYCRDLEIYLNSCY